jgi:hypothetical protein
VGRTFKLSLLSMLSMWVLLAAPRAHASAIEDSTRIGFFLGGRYVPHGHLLREAQERGNPIDSQTPFGFVGMLSFAYRVQQSLEISLEGGVMPDSYHLKSTGTMSLLSVPLGASLRWAPLDRMISPYLGGGGGYMLNFLSGAPTSQSEAHTSLYHFMVGATVDLGPHFQLFVEDRWMFSFPKILNLGETNGGGNAFMVGFSYILAPEPELAPHDKPRL